MEKYRASKLRIMNVPSNVERWFLAKNHLQGYIASSTCLGLVDDDNNLIELMSFGKCRFNKEYNIELLRLCTKKDCIVYGGASKLFNAYASTINEPIISYCNESVFTGGVYEKLGFTKIGTTNSYYYKAPNGDIILRYAMQKSSIKRANGVKENIQKTLEKYGATYDPNKTEKENAESAGFEFCKKVEATWIWGQEWYVYEITNNVNGKTYIGQHLKKNEDFNTYLGSGTNIRRAIEKYGKENFTKRILVDGIKSKEEVDRIELEEINKAKVVGKAEYNILTNQYTPSTHCLTDCWEARNATISKALSGKPKSPFTEEHKNNISKSLIGNRHASGAHNISDENRKNMAYWKGKEPPFKGCIHTEEAKRKNAESHKGKTPWNKGIKTGKPAWNSGLKGAQVAWNKGKSTGFKWYNNGTESKMFRENEQPECWVRGRLKKA